MLGSSGKDSTFIRKRFQSKEKLQTEIEQGNKSIRHSKQYPHKEIRGKK